MNIFVEKNVTAKREGSQAKSDLENSFHTETTPMVCRLLAGAEERKEEWTKHPDSLIGKTGDRDLFLRIMPM